MEQTITTLMGAADRGEASAARALFGMLYDELHRIAKRELSRQGGLVSIGPTTLLHQAYIEMAGREGTVFPDRGKFMGYAARVMRGLIIDQARSRFAQKRGGRFEITALRTGDAEQLVDDQELSRIGVALDDLAKVEAVLAEVVDLKFFCGFSFAEIGELQGIPERTAQRRWEKARIYLHRSLRTNLTL